VGQLTNDVSSMSQYKIGQRSALMIDSSHKICNECGETKPLKSFVMGRVRKDGTRSRQSKCYKCKDSKHIESKRRRQRDLARTDKRKQQVREAHDRYRQSRKYIERYNNTQLVAKEKRLLIKKRQGLVSRWEARREQVRRIDFLPLISIDDVWIDVLKFVNKRNNPRCTCKECGKRYHWTMYWRNTSACSIECRKQISRRNQRRARLKRKEKPDYKRLRNHRQRAKHYGVKYERVNIESIFVRDKYKCQGCGINVVRSKTYQPNQVTIDHMIPLSKGGSHTRDNLITLCHQCNSEKNDKTWKEWVVGVKM